eukprot:207163-Hanusia_phi.AAC.1
MYYQLDRVTTVTVGGRRRRRPGRGAVPSGGPPGTNDSRPEGPGPYGSGLARDAWLAGYGSRALRQHLLSYYRVECPRLSDLLSLFNIKFRTSPRR